MDKICFPKQRCLDPDVIVSDITMPLLGGIEAACLCFRESRPAARVVFLTVHNESEFIRACLDEGAFGYVIKAHMKDDLILAINAALNGKRFISSLPLDVEGSSVNSVRGDIGAATPHDRGKRWSAHGTREAHSVGESSGGRPPSTESNLNLIVEYPPLLFVSSFVMLWGRHISGHSGKRS